MTKVTIEGIIPGANRKPGDVGYDELVAQDTVVLPGLPRTIVPLSHKTALPYGTEEVTRPRSGFSSKGIEGYLLIPVHGKKVEPLTTGELQLTITYRVATEPMYFDADVIPGTIDPDYPGVVGAIVRSLDPHPFLIKAGTRICQSVFNDVVHPEFVQGEVAANTNRSGGFGTSGAR